jgi:ABC-2 type transport system ATP-binding protein
MLATLLEPDSGTARLFGADVRTDPMAVRAQIGYMPDFFGLYDDVKVWEYLDFFATIYRVPPARRPVVIGEVLELTNLTGKRDAFASTLSRGMQQRLALARCLVHDPTLLLLDEPASGLDPRARAELKELIAELGRMGKIVIVSSHILPELADFCNNIGIIERGRLLACGPVEQVAREFRPTRSLEVRLMSRAEEASMVAHGLPGVQGTQMMGAGVFRIEFTGDHSEQAAVLASLIKDGYPVIDFREREADLEDVFLRVTTGAVN